jgi:hypothetical protein
VLSERLFVIELPVGGRYIMTVYYAIKRYALELYIGGVDWRCGVQLFDSLRVKLGLCFVACVQFRVRVKGMRYPLSCASF